MATHQGSDQSHLVLPDYPATTEGLSSHDTALQHLLQPEKVNSLQTTDIPVSANPSPHLVYASYPQLVDYQPAVDRQPGGAESLVLHPGLTSELRALQMEGGFDTTSDFLHHLVVSEKVKRLQLQQRMTSRCNTYGNRDCASSTTAMPVLVHSTSSITYVNSLSANSAVGLDRIPSSCSLDRADETIQLCSINLEGTTTHSHQNQAGIGCRAKMESASVSVQVNLCQCRLDGQSVDDLRQGQLKKRKGNVISKVKKKKSCLLQEERDELNGDIKNILVKELLQNVKGHGRKSGRNRSLRLPDYPRQRLPRDTKSAPREKQEYLCEICGATFKWRRSLIPHMWEHRNEVSVHRCPHCSTSFPYACRLKRHLVAKHPEHEGGPIRCSTCGVEVQSYNTLKSHMRIHTGYKPFKCKFCPKTYKWNTGLEYHERVHTGERPFPCPRCSKAFTNKSDLTRHQTVHTGEKPHVCEKCGKGFTQSHTLKSHCKKHHPAADLQLDDSVGSLDNGIQKPCPTHLHCLPQSFQSGHQASFMLSGLQDPTTANHAMEQMKFTTNSGLHALQRQMPGVPTEREIAEVVVNMLTQ